jgi:DNA-binding MarR family transcriptional regulator
MNGRDNKEEQRLLELLDAVGRNSDVSQRHLARHMGVALGLANSYLKRCIRKGLIKISEAPANRYLYYLTPQGFSEKSRLTAKYLSTSFEFYRQASQSCARTLRGCDERGWRRLIFCGVSDLAEIAALRALEMDLTIVGTYDAASEKKKFLGRPVWRSLNDAGGFDAVILTDLQHPRAGYDDLIGAIGRERVLVPDILRL